MIKTFTFNQQKITPTCKIIFVSDLFVDEYVGGAELTSEALIQSCPFEIVKIKSKDLTMADLKNGFEKFWIFGNFTQINPNLIPSIISNLDYSILEYDFKFCKFRSPEKHILEEGKCDCEEQTIGKMISAFYSGSKYLWWMSENQKKLYQNKFPFLQSSNNLVLSSVFDPKTLLLIKQLKNSIQQRKGWIVLGSNSWIKGASEAEKWCKDNNKEYEVVWNISYENLLQKLALAEGFVYLPLGGDTCPRMVIEAKLLGCELILNENVLHKNEDWFQTSNIQEIEDYLYSAHSTFWNTIKNIMNHKPTISGYVTTFNCISQEYPFVECINSMLQVFDEVCVIDGGSADGTQEVLKQLAIDNPKLKIKVSLIDRGSQEFALSDGIQKALARKMCTKDFCWQMDCDEIIHELDNEKILNLIQSFPKQIDLVSLPVVEYWGGADKVRLDITPWKWRLSRNKPNITHGVPIELRKFNSSGKLIGAHLGTDGCDIIDEITGERIQFIGFLTSEAENTRQIALNGNKEALISYQNWFNDVVENLPSVYHFSWFNLERKIKLYRDYWQNHWESLFCEKIEDTAEKNMMFNSPWAQVTSEMIKQKAEELKQIGGWVWHKKWDGTITPWLSIKRNLPKIMQSK